MNRTSKYTGKGQAKQKPSPTPQFEVTHSKKPLRKESSLPIYKLLQLHKLDTKECFNLYTAKVSSLNATQFLSFQIVQKMQRGTDFQIFNLFLPTKESFQLIKASLIVLGKTQEMPIREQDLPQGTDHLTVQQKLRKFCFFLTYKSLSKMCFKS